MNFNFRSIRFVKFISCHFFPLLVLSGLAASAANASDEFWQSPLAQTSYNSSQVQDDQHMALNSSLPFESAQYESLQSSFSVVQKLNDTDAIAIQFANSHDQENFVFGYTHKNLTVSFMDGSGENYFQLGGSHSGIDPYLFHGGWHQKFRVNGFAADYSLNKFGHVQFGQATVSSPGLLDRKARYAEWSNNTLFARATHFARGGDKVGSSLESGFAFGGNKQVAFQSTRLNNGAKMDRIRLQLNGKKTRQYWLDLSANKHPLFRDSDDYRVMFSFKTLLGSKSALASYSNEVEATAEGAQNDDATAEDATDPQAKKKKGSGLTRGLLIGVGVAALASGGSSGSAAQDGSVRFASQNAAALDVLNNINPRSIAENREYGGWVYVNPDASYNYTTPVPGEAASVTLPFPSAVIPSGSMETASYHTHAAFDPMFDNENFSPTDLESDRAFGVDGYLATPGGQFKFHNVETGEIITLGRVATM